jgi:hypothetical protein
MLPYLIAGAIGFVVAKLFEDEAPKYADGGSVLLAPNGKPSKSKYTYEQIIENTKKYESYSDWVKQSRSFYDYSRLKGWLNDIKKEFEYTPTPPKHTLESIIENAKKYKSYKEWREERASEYQIAKIKGWLPQVKDAVSYIYIPFIVDGVNTSFRKSKNTLESVIENAKKYSSYGEWREKNPSEYVLSSKKGWLSEIKNQINYIRKTKRKPFTLELVRENAKKYSEQIKRKKTLESVIENAKKYSSYQEWQNNNLSEYTLSSKNGWLPEIKNVLGFVRKRKENPKKPSERETKYSLESTIENAKKYESYTEWRNDNIILYDVARIKGWLSEIKKLPNLATTPKYTLNSIIENATTFESYSDWRKTKPSEYQIAKIRGWLDDIKKAFQNNNSGFKEGGIVNVIDVKQYNVGGRNYRFVEIAEKNNNKIELYRQADDGNYYGHLLYRRVPRYDAEFSSPMVNDLNQLYAYEPVSDIDLFNAVKNRKKPFASLVYWLSYYTEEEIQKEIESFIDECHKYDLEYEIEDLIDEDSRLDRKKFQVCQKGTLDELFDIDALLEDYFKNDFDLYYVEKIIEFRDTQLSHFLTNEWDDNYSLTGLILGIPPKFTMALLNMGTTYGLGKDYKYDNKVIIMNK